SAFAAFLASSTTAAPRFSACEMISLACSRARCSSSPARFAASSRSCLPRSAAARPSAICFWRASMAFSSGGHTNFSVNPMNSRKAMPCAIIVKFRFIFLSPSREKQLALLGDDGEERVAEREQHGETDADDEGRVDQAQQQEHLGLQRRDHFRLARGAF